MGLKHKIVQIPLKRRFAQKHHNRLKSILDRILLHKDCCALFLVFVIFMALTFWTWRKWPDILIDFGRELYVPWQLASGKMLYKDIADYYGPFPPYFNALIFYLFGASFINLVYTNLIITVLLTLVIYVFFRKACDQYTAIFSCLIFLTFFAFAHFIPGGSFNWICPYSHNLTHSIVLSCSMLLIFQECIFRLRPGLLALGGICLGFVFLSKVEVSLAAATSALIGIALIFCVRKPRLGQALNFLCIFLGAVIVPIVACFVFLSKHLPVNEVLEHLSFSWRAVHESSVGPMIKSKFFLDRIGLDSPLRNLALMGAATVGLIFFACAIGMVNLSTDSPPKKKLAFIVFSAMLFLASFLIKGIPCLIAARSLPLMTLIFGAALIWLFVKRTGDPKITAKIAGLMVWSVFAFVLLSKMILNARFLDYGFALAMPATMLLVAGFLSLLPKVLRKLCGSGLSFRRIVASALIVDVIFALLLSNMSYSQKHFSIGQDGDRIITYQTKLSLSPAGPSISELLKQVERLVPKEASLASIPEGIMVNYLSRRVNPTRYTGFTPPEIVIYGERNILESVSDTKPDFIIIIPRDMPEFGIGFFGENLDYCRNIMAWVSEKYEKVWQEPEQQQQNNRLSISIFRRKIMATQ